MVRPLPSNSLKRSETRQNGDVEDSVHIIEDLLNPQHIFYIDNLLDTAIAVYYDCNLPILKRIRGVDQFLQKCKLFMTIFFLCLGNDSLNYCLVYP